MYEKIDHRLGHWLLLLILSLIWGSSFILMKRGLDAFSYQQVAALRLFIAFLFLMWLGRNYFFKTIPRAKLTPIFLTGLVGNGIPAFLFTKSETYLDSGVVGILNVLTPLFTIIIGLMFYRLKVTSINYVGILIGILGTSYLLYPDVQQFNEKSLLYCLMVIIATACYGWSTNIIKSELHDINSLQITTLAFSFIGPWAGIYLFSTDFVFVMQTHPKALSSLLYTALLAVIGSALSVILFNQLIKMTGALFATSCTYIIPIVAILWGILDEESITNRHLTGFIIILAGVYLVNKRA